MIGLSAFELQSFLNEKYEQYCSAAFIEDDPIQIPHKFDKKADIEIAGLFAATFAWGQRKTIINKCTDLLARMDNAPHDFVLNCTADDCKQFTGFAHRTFNADDVVGMVQTLQKWYTNNASLESLFIHPNDKENLKNGLHQFKKYFVNFPVLPRTQRHLPDPLKGSASKRINMYLRWMVRQDAVDFGIWKKLKPAQLSCPLDVHSGRVARSLNLLQRKQNDWRAVTELDNNLRKFDASDPVKYDFALFGLGVYEGFGS